MNKLIIFIVEGITEENFVKTVLRPHFNSLGIAVKPIIWETNKKLGAVGGGKNWDKVENFIRRIINTYRNRHTVFYTTMIDLYAFPKQGDSVYDADVERLQSGQQKALYLQQKMAERIGNANFIPYVQLHEFEALLLAAPDALSTYFTGIGHQLNQLMRDIDGMAPEDINETPDGAPSKRIAKYIPSYGKQKKAAGVIAAAEIGLLRLRNACPHFNDWIRRLETT